MAPATALFGYVADLALEPASLRIGRETPLAGGLPLHATRLRHIQVSMVTGYAAAEKVPANILLAIMMTTAFFYEHPAKIPPMIPTHMPANTCTD